MSAPLYPDLSAPPKGWTVGRLGNAIRLVPPGAYLDRSRAAIIVSPLMPRSRQLPEPAVLVAQALAAEIARTGSVLVSQDDPAAVRASSGLEGVRIALCLRRGGDNQVEKRIYVIYKDNTWMYGINYIADEETFPAFVETFEAAAASVLPTSAA